MTLIGLWVGAALAAGIHTGIPVHGVAGLGDPEFLTPKTGWTASIEGGFVRIYVGATEADAAAWTERTRAGIQVELPSIPGYADAAWGDPQTLIVFRDGNVAAMVRAKAGARDVADRLRAAIVDGGPAPRKPTLVQAGERWEAHAPDAVDVTFSGGRPAAGAPNVWIEPPTELVAWDAYGRATVWTLD
jgi:hypothetical protein